MNDYYTTMDYTQSNSNNTDVSAITAYPIMHYNAHTEAYKMMGNLFVKIAKMFTRWVFTKKNNCTYQSYSVGAVLIMYILLSVISDNDKLFI